MRQVPKALRAALAARGWRTGRAAEHARVAAADGTRKLLLQLADGRLVEAVGIPERDAAPGGGAGKQRLTACVSSQARAQRRQRPGHWVLQAAPPWVAPDQVRRGRARAGGLPDAVHVLRDRQGRVCAQPAHARDHRPGALRCKCGPCACTPRMHVRTRPPWCQRARPCAGAGHPGVLRPPRQQRGCARCARPAATRGVAGRNAHWVQ